MRSSTPISADTKPSGGLIGVSLGVEDLRAEIATAARSDAKVLLTGETGVGKEVVARQIHRVSRRAHAPFVAVNCGGVADTLLESEFFGHVRGSFTGAVRDYAGVLRLAHGGTVFLDEVGEMSLRMQALFLRFLETGELQTVGIGAARDRVNVRIITATNRQLAVAVAQRSFREDLFYRLNVFHLHILPLRERPEDVPLLLDHFAREFSAHYGCPAPAFTADALSMLRAYPWPGNVRELRNVVEQLVSRGVASSIRCEHLPPAIRAEVRRGGFPSAMARASAATPRVEALLHRLLVEKACFWTAVYPSFMQRDLTREDLRHLVRCGLERSRGSYRLLTALFNVGDEDYKRFLSFLKQHDCHVPFQEFRKPAPASEQPPDVAARAV